MIDTFSKKRKVSKKTKKSWRKHVNHNDVDAFLDNSLLEERLGGPFSLKPDVQLFAVDTSRIGEVVKVNKNSKLQLRLLMKNKEPRCFAYLKSHSAVPDPIVKRNHVKSREERKSSIVKCKEAERKINRKLKLKEKDAINNRIRADERRAIRPKREDFIIDIWKKQSSLEPELNSQWLTTDTLRHTLSNTGKKMKRTPSSLYKKPSITPAVTVPHPGASYNPAYSDHQELLAQVAEQEIKLMKEEAHLNRVTNHMFRKVFWYFVMAEC